VGVHEVGFEDGVYFLSMEYVGGGSVQIGFERRKLEALRAAEIILQPQKLWIRRKAGSCTAISSRII